MSEKDIKFDNIVKALCPPFIYFFITLIIEAVIDIILFIRQTNLIKDLGSANFMSSYTFMKNIEDNLDKYSYLITFISAFIAVIVFGIIYSKLSNEYEKKGFVNQLKKINIKMIILLMVIGFFGSLGLGRFVSILPLDNIIGNYESTSNALMSGSLILQIFSLAIVVPVAEELIYRGLVFSRLTKLMDAKYAIIVASTIFGVFHFNLLQGMYAFLLSLILICVYMKYKTIIAPIIVHGIANFTAVIFSYFKISEYFNRSIWLYIAVMTVELIVSVCIFDIIMKDENKK